MPEFREHQIVLRFLAEPSDVNFGGTVHGGAVMKWIDHAGYTCAANWSGSYCVTAYVGGIRFLEPIAVGDLVELRAEIMHTGRTSMHVSVSVYARDPREPDARFTTHCILVFVAMHDQGRPKAIPAFTPQGAHQQRMNDYARKMIELRRKLDNEAGSFLRDLELDAGNG